MHAAKMKSSLTFSWIIIIGQLIYGVFTLEQLPSPQTLSKWNFMLESQLTQLATTVTQFETIKQWYTGDAKNINLREVRGMDTLKQTLTRMRRMLEKKEAALQRLVTAAEAAVAAHVEDSQLSLSQVPFLNMKEVKKNDERLQFSPHFLQNVTFNESGVHIPLEIYEGWMGHRYKVVWWHDPQILNGLKWSSALEEVFKENLRLDPTLRWQYFGSQRGFMRVYPAFRWPEIPNLPDLFDVRRRSWYIQGCVSPKDMIILIDTSGSVHGQTFDIMKIAVKALLHTLGENDYVNVAWFNNEVGWVIPCLNTLVQATSHHKRLLFDAVDQLQEGNLTSYATALEFAFDAFKKFEERRKPWEGSNCHKVIMFFSDGGTEWPEEILRRYRNDSTTDSVRLFTYACGPHPIPTVILKSMACETQGYFNTITALGAIRTRIQDYVRILSRPLILSGDDNLFQWSNFYRDIGGLGMMTTVTLPVSNESAVGNNQTLLGVMGVDVPLSEMETLFSKRILGPIGYGFAINPNGFVVFHPRLQEQITYIEEPPDIDLLELEGRTEVMLKLRNAMVSGDTGSMQAVLTPQIVDSNHAIPIKMNYYYGPIGNTTFRFALAIPMDYSSLEVSGLSHEAGLRFESPKGILLAPWIYCTDLEEDPSVMTLSEAIANNTYDCDSLLIQQLLWDAAKIGEVWKLWEETPLQRIHNRFLFTDSGLTAVYPEKEVVHYLSQRDPNHNGFYKRALQMKGFILSVKHSKRNGIRGTTIAMGHKIMVEQGDRSYTVAVAGAEVEQSWVQEIFSNVTGTGLQGAQDAPSSRQIQEEVLCSDPDRLSCYLIDDGSVIIASNQPHVKVGSLLGTADSQLMVELLEGGMFVREDRYNYQAWCPYHTTGSDVPASAATSMPATILTHMAAWLWDMAHLLNFLKYSLSSLLFWSLPQTSESMSAFGWEPSSNSGRRRNHSCVSQSSWFHHTGKPHLIGVWECGEEYGNCTRPLTAAFLPSVSLLLVVADMPCPCQKQPSLFTPEGEQQSVGPDVCNNEVPFRVRPSSCYSLSEKENTTDCGSSAGWLHTHSRIFWLLILIMLCLGGQLHVP